MISHHTDLDEDIFEVLERFSETCLFRDWNDSRVNEQLHLMFDELCKVAMVYVEKGKPNG